MRAGWLVGLFLTSGLWGAEPVDPQKGKVDGKNPDLIWYDARDVGVEGKGWKDTKAYYDRLPARAEGVVRPPVWSLSRHSAGLVVPFASSAPTIQARWTLTSAGLAMPHMPATGVSGLDLYVKTREGKWRWLANGRPSAKTNTAQLVGGLPAEEREYLLYLPLYNGVETLEIGIPRKHSLRRLTRPQDGQKPIVFYGTSITQGGCASRPGMVHTAILGRWLDRPVINLGFSGNGRMDPEVGTLLAEIDAAVYVIDCLPNMNATDVAARTAPLVTALRKAHPSTPILLVEDRSYANSFLVQSQAQRNQTSRAALREAYQKLLDQGVKGLHYLSGDQLLGEDGEDTVDSSHPTDLGFLRHAEAFVKVLRPILE